MTANPTYPHVPTPATAPAGPTGIAESYSLSDKENTVTNPHHPHHHHTPTPDGVEHVGDWNDAAPTPYRILHAPIRRIDGHPLAVWTTAGQSTGGRIDVDQEPPTIRIDILWEHGLDATQARQLAAILAGCADQIDGWVATAAAAAAVDGEASGGGQWIHTLAAAAALAVCGRELTETRATLADCADGLAGARRTRLLQVISQLGDAADSVGRLKAVLAADLGEAGGVDA
jgi:hypothetical protein